MILVYFQTPDSGCSGSEYEAVDYEDDWPGSKQSGSNNMKIRQKFTFKNPMISKSPDLVPAGETHTNGRTHLIGSPNRQEARDNRMHLIGSANRDSRINSNLMPPSGKKSKQGNNGRNSDKMKSIKRRKPANALLARRKVIRLLIAVIVSFATCVLPYHIRVLYQYWGDPHFSFWAALMTPSTFLLFYMNSGLNPLLYAFLSDNFRRSLREVLLCGGRRLGRGLSTMSSTSMRTASTGYTHSTHSHSTS